MPVSSYSLVSTPDLLTVAVVADPNFTALASDWEEPFPIKSITYNTNDSKLFSAVRDALHDDEYEELKESRLRVFLKFKKMDFGWASKLVHYMLCFQLNIKKKYELWSLVGADPVRFSLIEFEQLTGLNCEYIEHLENPKYEGIYPWTNPKTHVVYVKEKTSVKSLVVREEDIERPSKRPRIEAPAEPCSEDIPDARSGAIPDARSEASIPVSGVDKAYIEKCFKDLTDVMRDEFGTCLKEMKLLGNRMDVVEKKLRITGKESSSDDLQHTTSSLPKRRLEYESESVNGAKVRQDEEPSSSKTLSVEAKEKKLKEKANKGLEKALAKEKEAKAKEAKAKEAKAKEAKAKEAKAKENEAKKKEAKEKEAKKKEEKEAKLAAEAWLGEAKLEEEAKAKEAADKAKEPEASAEASVVLMDKDEDTVSDVKMQEARRLSKKDSALATTRGRSERERKLAASRQFPFQRNNTAKLIIPNTKVGHGYDPFALSDKQLTNALMEHLKKILYWDDYAEDLQHMDAYINVLRLRQRNNPNHFRSERICFLDHLFSWMWRDKYGEFKSSLPNHNGLGRRLPSGSWDLYAGIVPIFCATNKTWGVDIDDIYAPVNFQNDHWIAIWISIPNRHIVVWDSIVKHISKAQLDEIMEFFLTMVPYLLVECASTDEERIKYSLESFTYERPAIGVSQCIAGDCGVYALKYMECHALGYTSFPAAFCEKNVKHIREKMVHDIFHATPGFEGIEDKTSYYNDLDTYG
ncbi:hypothetical protein N665_0021s0022 [Sinapis alba]|nr:hypothetical protein N665_0021s0022 [Sinapis alba]